MFWYCCVCLSPPCAIIEACICLHSNGRRPLWFCELNAYKSNVSVALPLIVPCVWHLNAMVYTLRLHLCCRLQDGLKGRSIWSHNGGVFSRAHSSCYLPTLGRLIK